MALAYLEWLSKRRVRNRGFSKSFINEKTKWFFTEETKEGTINNFKIKCDITRENSNKTQFKAFVKHKQIDKNELNRFKKYQVIFDFEGLTKIYDINRHRTVSV